jgi:hypothetical protein
MNNLKCQYLVSECMIDFPIATRNPSYANSWIYLPDSMIKVDVKHRQPTCNLQSLLLYTMQVLRCRRAEKDLLKNVKTVMVDG